MKRVSIIGAGSWGTALAKLLAERSDLSVQLWVRKPEQAKIIKAKRENPFYLKNVALPANLEIITDLQDAFPADLLVLAVPSQAVREICSQLAPLIAGQQIIVSCAKGLEDGSFLRMSEVIQSECPQALVCAMSGPNHAEEVAVKQPTATVIGCTQPEIAAKVQKVFTSAYFRPYTNTDIVGVELGGALKNIIAIALGILDGLAYQDNAKSATMTRGLAEVSRMGVAMGAKPSTFLGLSGMGDLIGTCMSKHSRNRWAGEQLALGFSLDQVLAKTNMVVEGVRAVQSAYALSEKLAVQMPITFELYKVLYQNKLVSEAVLDLMRREYKSED